MINITRWIKGLLLVTAGVVIFNTSLVQALRWISLKRVMDLLPRCVRIRRVKMCLR